MVKVIGEPATTVGESAAWLIVNAGSSTLTVHSQSGFCVPGGQLLPGASERTVVIMFLSPVSGFNTVTEKLIETASPSPMSPVQVRSGSE